MKNYTFFLFVLFSTKLYAQCTPPAGITVYNNLNGSSIVCPNSSYTLLASPNNVGPYQWTKNGTVVPSTTYVFPYDGNTLAVGDVITCAPVSNLSCPSQYTVSFLKTVYTTSLAANPSGQIISGTSVTFTGSISDNHGSLFSYGFFINGVLQGSYHPTNQRTFSFTTNTLANGDVVYTTTQAGSAANPCGYIDTSNLVTVSVSSILPVTLSQFNVKATANKFSLDWITTSATNVDYFNIQESIDGQTFTTIGKVDASNETMMPKQYAFDYQPVSYTSAPHYFRLQVLDKDGKLTYSTIQKNTLRSAIGFSVSPNPATNSILINGVGVNQVRLFDMSGKLLLEQKNGQNSYQLNVSSFARGVYLLHVLTANSQIAIQKIVLK